jgi:UDP-glucose 4-epimerase
LTRTAIDAQQRRMIRTRSRSTPDPAAEPLVPAPWGSAIAFVTGAAGFLGGAMAVALTEAGWTVAGFGHPPRGPTAGQLQALASWREGDVEAASLADAAARLGPPELVFHAAGGASVGASLADPAADALRTVGSLRQTLDFMRQAASAARLLYPSSAAVYGAEHPGPIAEQDELNPISPYGRHKLQAEQLIGEAVAGFGLDAVVIRFFSLYGPGLRKQLPFELAGRLLAAPPRIQLSGTGAEVRDFLYVTDAVRLLGMAARLPRRSDPVVLNGGAGEAVTVRALAEGLRAAVGSTASIGFSGEVRPGDPASLLADASRATALGFAPAVDLQAGLEALAEWVREETAASA